MPMCRAASPFVAEELESRILYSADVGLLGAPQPGSAFLAGGPQPLQMAPVVLPGAGAHDRAGNAETAVDGVETGMANRHEVVFIDSAVDAAPALAGQMRAGQEAGRTRDVYVLDSGSDGVAQIGAILATQHDVDALHIISHGRDGELELGSARLNDSSLRSNAIAVSHWGESMSAGASILLYGGDVARTSAGQHFVDSLALLTGADTAVASTAAAVHQQAAGATTTLPEQAAGVPAAVQPGAVATAAGANTADREMHFYDTGAFDGRGLGADFRTNAPDRFEAVSATIAVAPSTNAALLSRPVGQPGQAFNAGTVLQAGEGRDLLAPAAPDGAAPPMQLASASIASSDRAAASSGAASGPRSTIDQAPAAAGPGSLAVDAAASGDRTVMQPGVVQSGAAVLLAPEGGHAVLEPELAGWKTTVLRQSRMMNPADAVVQPGRYRSLSDEAPEGEGQAGPWMVRLDETGADHPGARELVKVDQAAAGLGLPALGALAELVRKALLLGSVLFGMPAWLRAETRAGAGMRADGPAPVKDQPAESERLDQTDQADAVEKLFDDVAGTTGKRGRVDDWRA